MRMLLALFETRLNMTTATQTRYDHMAFMRAVPGGTFPRRPRGGSGCEATRAATGGPGELGDGGGGCDDDRGVGGRGEGPNQLRR
jgi:hypothetical protein